MTDNDDSNPSEIIPISFHMYKILEDNMNTFGKYNDNFGNEKYLIQTHSQAQIVVQNSLKFMEYKKVRSKLKTRKATYHSQTCKSEAANGSRKSRIKEEET